MSGHSGSCGCLSREIASKTTSVDLSGQTFGYLTAKYDAGRGSHGRLWFCTCKCGNTKVVPATYLLKNVTNSCGCLRNEKLGKIHQKNATHGMSSTRLYNTWAHMIQRCRNPHSDSYRHYGARNIQVAQEWVDSFETFSNWALSHGYNDQLTIERIDVNGNYEPDNCCWIPLVDQAVNRRNNHFVEYQGQRMTMTAFAKVIGCPTGSIRALLKRCDDDCELAAQTFTEQQKLPWPFPLLYKGRVYMNYNSLRDVARVAPAALKQRIERDGWEIERAIETPSRTIQKERKCKHE